MKRYPVFALFLSLMGCMTASVTAPRDPLAGINLAIADPAYKGLTLGLILSRNTKEGMSSVPTGKTCLVGWDPQAWFTESVARLRKNFKRVVSIENPSEAAAAGADLIAVLDDTAVNSCIAVTLDLKLSAIFFTLDQKQIDAVSGENVKGNSKHNPAWWNYASKGSGRLITVASIVQAIKEAEDNFESAVISSAKLQEFARSKSSAAPAVAVSAAAEPIYRSDVDVPGYKLRENPDDFALVVGVGKYKSLPEAKFAERDALIVREHLAALGVPRRNIVSLTGSDATRASLQSYLEEWLPKNVLPGSAVYVYYSGHGAPDVKTGEAYLVPWDGDPKFLKSSAYSTKQLYASLGALKAKKIVVALDACFSGAGGRSVLPDGARPLVMKVDEGFSPQDNLALFAAAAGDEITGSLDEQGHGMFTYFFLKGLSSGKRSARELYEYLKPKVQAEARRQNREQTPAFSGADLSL